MSHDPLKGQSSFCTYLFMNSGNDAKFNPSFLLHLKYQLIFWTTVGHMQKENPLLKQLHSCCFLFFFFSFRGRKGNEGLSKVNLDFFRRSHMLHVKAQNYKWPDSSTLSDDEQSFIAQVVLL